MIGSYGDLARVLAVVYRGDHPPKPLHLFIAVARVRKGEDIGEVAAEFKTSTHHLRRIVDSPEPLEAVLKAPFAPPPPEELKRAKKNLGQLVLGHVAERAFEDIYRATMGATAEFRLEDDRTDHSDTDYRVLNGKGRRVFRANIKFFGSPFRNAKPLVSLEPEDCFALATYKINAALEKQQEEHLPFVFLIVGVPGLTGLDVGEALPADLVELVALMHTLPRVSGKRGVEDRVVEALYARQDELEVRSALESYYARIRHAPWFALGAKRAVEKLRELLFARVYALRLRGFARNYKGAEVDMHFSLSQDLTPFSEFLRILQAEGSQGIVARLSSGAI